MPLKLSLKPGETFVLNGAVVQNGDRRGVLVLQNQVSVLRERDIMKAQDAHSPARRIYFALMMMYLDPSQATPHATLFIQELAEFTSAARDDAIFADCLSLSKLVVEGEIYKALMACRKLIDREDRVLDQGAPGMRAPACAG